jgi:hypothetical protein
MNNYNVWCKWHPLEVVLLGQPYPVNFYRNIKNDKIKSALTRITEETLEDLENFASVLKSYGAEVLRIDLDPNESIVGEDQKFTKIPRSPLQPRDAQLVIGDKLFVTSQDNPQILKRIKEYNEKDISFLCKEFKKENYTWAPNITVVGKDVYVDKRGTENCNQEVLSQHVKELGMRWHWLDIGGHNDGCFHTLKPNVLLSLLHVQMYSETFPGWDIGWLKGESWEKVAPFLEMKQKVNGKWFVPGEENNDEFIQFVETWLNDWVGYVQESVFDVNVLMLDDKNICVSNYNKKAFEFFKKHKIEPTIVPWRHRYFWDGGLHCITLDLKRRGQMEDYFPNRGNTSIHSKSVRGTNVLMINGKY